MKEKKFRPSGPFPSLPSGMDAVIKKHFDEYRGTDRLPPELEDKALDAGIALFEDAQLISQWRNQRSGLVWTDSQGNTLRGAVDDALKKDGKLIVLDYKTRGYPLKNKPAYYQLQLDAYNFLLRKKGFNTENYALLLFYYPESMKETSVVFKTKLVTMDVNVENAQKTFAGAITLLEGTKPEKNKKCGFCSWKS